jgi:hypothetical protein
MSKRQGRATPETQRVMPEEGRTDAQEVKTVDPARIAECRRCPICWNGNGGYGDCTSTRDGVRYYKCRKTLDSTRPPCGHTWTAHVQLIVTKIEHRVVTLDGER